MWVQRMEPKSGIEKLADGRRQRRLAAMVYLASTMILFVYGSLCFFLRDACLYPSIFYVGVTGLISSSLFVISISGENLYKFWIQILTLHVGVLAFAHCLFHFSTLFLVKLTGFYGQRTTNYSGEVPMVLVFLCSVLCGALTAHAICWYKSVQSAYVLWKHQEATEDLGLSHENGYSADSVGPNKLPCYLVADLDESYVMDMDTSQCHAITNHVYDHLDYDHDMRLGDEDSDDTD